MPDDIDTERVTVEHYREVSKDSKMEFEEELHLLVRRHLHQEFGYSPVLGRPVLTTRQIDEVCDRLHGIRTEADVEDLVKDRKIQQEILALVFDFFRDIPHHYIDEKLAQKSTFEESSYDDWYNPVNFVSHDDEDTDVEIEMTIAELFDE